MKTKVTLDNYSQYLQNYSIDIKDEVRNALLDGIDLIPYVKKCANDPFRLQQIRLAKKEFPNIQEEFFKLDGANLFKAREYLRKNLLSNQAIQILQANVDPEGWDVMLELDSKGYDLSKYDFSKIPNHLLSEFKWGIQLGLDISHLVTGADYPKEFVLACIKLETLGVKTLRFIQESWDWGTVIEISKYTPYPHLEFLLEQLSNRSIPEYVGCFVDLINGGVLCDKVYEKDEFGYEIFMPSQLEFIAETAKDGFNISSMLNPELSLEEMYILKGIEREKTGRRLKGVLGR